MDADFKLLEYRPSLIAVSALQCCLNELMPSSCSHLAAATTSLSNHFTKVQIFKPSFSKYIEVRCWTDNKIFNLLGWSSEVSYDDEITAGGAIIRYISQWETWDVAFESCDSFGEGEGWHLWFPSWFVYLQTAWLQH